MNNDLWANEKKVVFIFRRLCDEVGYARADLAWAEANLNDDTSEENKVERAIKVAKKLSDTFVYD